MPLKTIRNSILFLLIHSISLNHAILTQAQAQTQVPRPGPSKASPPPPLPKKSATTQQPAADFVKPSSQSSTGTKNKAADFAGDADFQAKIREMSVRIGKALTLIREQILKNQSAPFLSDLYLQLGDLLSTKAMILYFQKMETDKGMSLQMTEVDKSSPIVEAQLEAIRPTRKFLRNFLNSTKRIRFSIVCQFRSNPLGKAQPFWSPPRS
ncbi:MAG: hypothetical protein IPK04_20250 [Bdellovibrionales bacterium]|nr:hypothetical protein [Bdellovibrionales bacterium]